MTEVELDELVMLLKHHLDECGTAPPVSMIATTADRLAGLLAAVPDTDPRHLQLVLYRWQRFWAQPVGEREEELWSAFERAAPLIERDSLPLGLRVLLDVGPDWKAEPAHWPFGDVTDPDGAIALLEVAVHLTHEEGRQRAYCLDQLAVRRFDRYSATGSLVDLDAAIDARSEVLSILGEEDAQATGLYAGVAVMLRSRYSERGAPEDLENAIMAGRRAPQGDPLVMSGLAIALRWRHESRGGEADLGEAIPLARRAVSLMGPTHPEAHIALTNLARLLFEMFGSAGAEHDRAEASAVAARAVAAASRDKNSPVYVDALDIHLEVLTHAAINRRDAGGLEQAFEVVDELLAVVKSRSQRGRYLRWRRHLLILGCEGGEPADQLNRAVAFARVLNESQLADQLTADDVLTLAQLLLRRADITSDITDAATAVGLMANLFRVPPGRAHPLAPQVLAAVEELAETGDPAILFDEALNGTDLLARAPLGTAPDLGTKCRLGWLLWFRSHFQEDQQLDCQDKQHALELFRPLHQVAPFVLPGQVRELIDDLESGDRATDAFESRSMFAWLSYEDSGSRRLLSAALETARLAVESSLRRGASAEATALNNLAVVIMSLPADELIEPLLREAVRALRRAVELSSPEDPYLPGRLSALCGALGELYRCNRDPAVFDEGVSAGRRGVDLTPVGHPSAGMHLANLATILWRRPSLTMDELVEVVDMLRTARVLMAPSHHGWAAVLSNLGRALSDLGERTGSVELLAEAVRMTQDVDAGLAAESYRPAILSGLVTAQTRRFELTADPEHLAEAIGSARRRYSLLPPGTSSAQEAALDLARLLRAVGARDQICEAAELLRANVRVPEPITYDAVQRLALVGATLFELADVLGDETVWRDGLAALRSSVDVEPPGDELFGDRLALLMTGLQDAYDVLGDVRLLREAIQLWDAVHAATPEDHPNFPGRMGAHITALLRLHFDLGDNSRVEEAHSLAVRAAGLPGAGIQQQMNLAEAMTVKAKLTGDLALHGDAVRIGRAALRSTDGNSGPIGNFPAMLLQYYEQTDALELLDDAIEFSRRALADDSMSRKSTAATWQVLAQGLAHRFSATGEPEALREAVQAQRRAAEEVPAGLSYRAVYLVNLEGDLLNLYGIDRNPALLEEAIDCGRAAVVAARDSPAFRALAGALLACALLTELRRANDPALLVEAEQIAEAAVRDGGDGHPQRDALLDALAQVLTLSGERDKVMRARDLHREAARYSSGTNRNQFMSAECWARLSMSLGDPEDALRACEHAVEVLLVQVGPALRRADRERLIESASWLPRTAAAAALSSGRPELAVELLEQTRGILLAEAMNDRMDLSDVEASAPGLAAEFAQINAELMGAHRVRELGQAGGLTIEERSELADRRRRLIDRIRELPGREGFLRRTPITALQQRIGGDPVVIVTASEWRCDALVLGGDSVEVVELPADVAEVVRRVNGYLRALEEFGLARANFFAARDDSRLKEEFYARLAAMESTIHETLEWLWNAITEPVLGHLGHTSVVGHGPWPQVLWCPVGPFALLPLHAAGHHRTKPELSVIDRVVSSYTPTLRVLDAVRSDRERQADPRLLVVSVTATGEPELPNSERECDLLQSLFADRCTVLEGTDATRAAVLDGLAGHDWVHLSCHGRQDLSDPSRGGLLLSDGTLSITDVNAHDAELVFLAACQTATTGVRLTDEMMTLAAAMRYGGSRHVIGTMWTVYDSVAADVAESVYQYLTRSGHPKPHETGLALHHAIRELRSRHKNNPSVWTPFVHVGS